MAEKGWTAQVAAAAGVAAGTGAAQLGLGYGLGVVEWPAVPAGDSVWLGSLGWATWIAASSTVFGAVIAGRLGRATGGPWRFALAASAAVGALLTVALIALPARAAVRTDTFAPQTIAGGYAVLGVLLGLVIAYWAVICRPVAANLIATAAWLWSLAAAAVAATIFWHRPSATYLSSWQFVSPDNADGQHGTIYWPSAALTLLAALVVGTIGALPAVRRGDLGVGAASSGAVGPLLVAAAFLALAPRLTGVPGPLLSAYLIAPYAVLAGLAGSALTVALGQRRAARRATRAAAGRGAAARVGGSAAASAAPAAARPASPAAAPPAASPAPPAAKASRPAPPSAAAAPAAPAAGPDGSGTAEAPEPQSRPRRSFMARFRRKSAGQGGAQAADDQSAAAKGRAKAPAASTSPAPEASRPASAQSGSPSAGAAAVAAPRPAATRGKPSAASAPGKPAATPRAAPNDGESSPPRPAGTPGAAPARGKSSAAPPAGTSKPGAASIDGGARPASSAPGRSDSRSTVAPPPDSPPIAKINEAQSGEKRPAPQKSTARPGAGAGAGPANTASSDKTPPVQKNPTKSTKAAPTARPATPRQATSSRATGAKAATPAKPSPPDATAKEANEADTVELPVQDPKRRGSDPLS